MKPFNRRSFLHSVAAIPMLGVVASIIRADDYPPGHPPRKPVGEVAVTKDMKVTISAQSGDFVYFEGKALEIKVTIPPKPDEPKDKVASKPFGSKDLAKLPAGEFSFDEILLSDAKSKHQVVVKIDEVHCPGMTTDPLIQYFKATQDGQNGGQAPSMLIKVDGGGSLWLEGIESFNVPSASGSTKGQKLVGVRIVAKTALRID